jgi:hypothetical protein
MGKGTVFYGLHPLMVVPDDVGLVSVGGHDTRSTVHDVLDGGDISRPEDVPTTPAVEAVHRGITPSTPQ